MVPKSPPQIVSRREFGAKSPAQGLEREMGTSPWPKPLQKQPQEDGLGLKTEMGISRGQKPSTKTLRESVGG